MKFTQPLPLALYVHLPWCVRKCPYCDFNSHEAGQALPQEIAYIDALLRDLDTELPKIRGRHIVSVFIGGGTPSLFSAVSVRRLLEALRTRLDLHPDTEITLEANPGTAEAAKFQAFRAAGVNRLSVGVQSFDNKKLQALGRIHDGNEAHAAIAMARAAGFAELNIDLMFGLPGQDKEEALRDLRQAADHGPTHISWYQLTLEPNTVFYAKPPVLPDEDLTWRMQEEGRRLLAEMGYAQYEISAYARPGHRCRHNLNYWEFGDYLGIGAGAHSKLTDVTSGKVVRSARHRLPERYLELAGGGGVITARRELDEGDLVLEFMMNVLRLKDGVHPASFPQRTGVPLDMLRDKLEAAGDRGLLARDRHTLRPTRKGQRYLNDLLELFLPETEAAISATQARIEARNL